MITPNQIKEKQLDTATHGYDIDKTNAFINEIADSYAAVYAENKELQRKMEILANKIVEYREEEDSIKKAILVAQKTAAKISKDAKDKAESLKKETDETAKKTVENAKAEAEKLISEARDYVANLTREKTAIANEIASEAEKKAGSILSNAKTAVQDMFTQTKNLSDNLIVKAREEKEYHEALVSKLKEESDSFKANLIAIYEAQLEKVKNMADPSAEIAKTLAAEKLSQVENQFSDVKELVQDAIGEEEPAEEAQEEVTVEEKTEELTEEKAEEQVEVKAEEPAEEQTEETAEAEPEPEEPAEAETEAVSEEPAAEKKSEEKIITVKDAEVEDISEPEEKEPSVLDVNIDNAIDAFSKDEITPNEGHPVTEITEEPEMEQPAEKKEEELPFEKFFGVKPEGRTTEKISLIPPDDFEEDDDELKFRGFFKKKNKK
ncbi:MAG: DivIVA domain-containing protein [Eubacterium sp.]|nr:DivIVA domain-containing protein [Eubacterium sp.]